MDMESQNDLNKENLVHYNEGWLWVPAIGQVVLGLEFTVNCRPGTMVEYHLIKGWLNQRKCNRELKRRGHDR